MQAINNRIHNAVAQAQLELDQTKRSKRQLEEQLVAMQKHLHQLQQDLQLIVGWANAFALLRGLKGVADPFSVASLVDLLEGHLIGDVEARQAAKAQVGMILEEHNRKLREAAEAAAEEERIKREKASTAAGVAESERRLKGTSKTYDV